MTDRLLLGIERAESAVPLLLLQNGSLVDAIELAVSDHRDLSDVVKSALEAIDAPAEILVCGGDLGAAIECPAGAAELAKCAEKVACQGRTITLIPRLQNENGTPGVLRHEHLRILGATVDHPLPVFLTIGSCNAWASVHDSRLRCFRRFEVENQWNALYVRDEVAEAIRLRPDPCLASFRRGLTSIEEGKTLPDAVDALLGHPDISGPRDYLNGVLFGSEIQSASEGFPIGEIGVIAEPCETLTRYLTALRRFGWRPTLINHLKATANGFARVDQWLRR